MKKWHIVGLGAIIVLIAGIVVAEQMTFSTYYPAPAGRYREFSTTGRTTLATDEFGTEGTNARVGIGTTNPRARLEIKNGALFLTDSDVSTGLTDFYPAETYGFLKPVSDTSGGLRIEGLSDAGDNPGLMFLGYIDDPVDTTPVVVFRADKYGAPSTSAPLDATETAFQFQSFSPEFGGKTLMTILGNGNVGIGTTNPQAKLDVAGQIFMSGDGIIINPPQVDAFPYLYFRNGSNLGADIFMNSDGNLYFRTKDDETYNNRLAILNSGNVRILSLSGGGDVYSNASGDLYNTSDQRFKKNIKTISNQIDVIDKLKQLRGVYFNWDQEAIKRVKGLDFDDQTEMGMVAQEVEQVIPEVVGTDKEGYKTLSSSKLVGFLIEVNKVQQKQINELKQRILALEQR